MTPVTCVVAGAAAAAPGRGAGEGVPCLGVEHGHQHRLHHEDPGLHLAPLHAAALGQIAQPHLHHTCTIFSLQQQHNQNCLLNLNLKVVSIYIVLFSLNV